MQQNGNMLSNKRLAEVLELEHLNLPKPPRVEDVQFTDYIDSTDEAALEICVIISDETGDEEISLDRVDAVREAIRNALEAAGESRWPISRFSRVENMRRAQARAR